MQGRTQKRPLAGGGGPGLDLLPFHTQIRAQLSYISPVDVARAERPPIGALPSSCPAASSPIEAPCAIKGGVRAHSCTSIHQLLSEDLRTRTELQFCGPCLPLAATLSTQMIAYLLLSLLLSTSLQSAQGKWPALPAARLAATCLACRPALLPACVKVPGSAILPPCLQVAKCRFALRLTGC